jgi:hypothetical protein
MWDPGFPPQHQHHTHTNYKYISICVYVYIYTYTYIWHKKQTHRLMKQNREASSKSCNYSELIFSKDARSMQWRKDGLFNKWCWKTIQKQRNVPGPSSQPLDMNHTQWIKGINIRFETKKTGEHWPGQWAEFDTKSSGNKSKNRQIGLKQTKIFYTTKEAIKST